ncbi:carboxypeptidase regulatory-like domain protein [Porphyromonas sp. oral taxon 279 str. F0450]|uniref:TonB-dependent receptor n=1 Tax=Porphyromonas sp. oral taxon 279 TaxID=712438 RepID=UPI00027C4DA2|nr:carboxypeptidase-like regulatory domain-containing protein [Porphyromonas sp. oral taxon 279]EJU16986.1 carboxypeptidase regulatory-like domain protein [Porphyromonas sp. oral taxon 279 str. F0450]
MNKSCLIALLLMLAPLNLLAQIEVRGQVEDMKTKAPIALASVTLVSERDSTLVLRGATDLQGGYLFSDVKVGRYLLRISFLGYKPLERRLRIVMPSQGFTVELLDQLQQDSQVLEDVVVQAKATHQRADRRVITFAPKDVRKALHSYDLLKTLPSVSFDVMNDRLKGAMGGEVQLLINGIRSTKTDVLMLPKEKIKRVEVYDIPPARYRAVECVINIIVSGLDDGYIAGGSLNHAFTTGFGNDEAYASLISGRHKLSLEYTLNYRDYRDRESLAQYSYNLNQQALQLTYSDHDAFGYTTHSPALKYAYVVDERYLWEARLQPRAERRFSDNIESGLYTADGVAGEKLTTTGRDRTQQFNPSLDLYHWRKLGEKDELSLNLVGTLFSTKRDTKTREQGVATGVTSYEDFMKLDNSKRSLILEATHTRETGRLRISSGYRGEVSFLHSQVDNHFGILDYTSRTWQHYGYSEISGLQGRFLYRLSLGLTHTHNRSSYRSYSTLAFTPKVVLGYTLGGGSDLRLMYDDKPILPSLEQLSSNRRRTTRDITEVGNPQLENAHMRQLTAMYSHAKGIFDIKLVGLYSHTHRPHIQAMKREGAGITFAPINGAWDDELAAAAKVAVKPFGDNTLLIDTYLIAAHSRLRSSEISYDRGSLYGQFSLTAQHKGLQLYYKYALPAYGYDSGYASRMEPEHTASLSYRLGNWKFSASMLFIGTPAYYHDYTLGERLVQWSSETWIDDNKNMILLGVAYHFSRGKDKTYSKNLQNEDTSSPTL